MVINGLRMSRQKTRSGMMNADSAVTAALGKEHEKITAKTQPTDPIPLKNVTEINQTNAVSQLTPVFAAQNETLKNFIEQQNAKMQEFSESFLMFQNQFTPFTAQPYFDQPDEFYEDDVDMLMNEITQNESEQDIREEAVGSLDDEVQELLQELEKPEDFGQKVDTVTAKAFMAIPQYNAGKEIVEKWKLLYKTPENCKNLVVPQVNTEIWNSLPLHARTTDAKFQALQQHLVRAQIAQARAMDVILKEMSKTAMPSALRPLLDASKAVAVVMQDINQRRKGALKSVIRPEYAALCSPKTPVTNFLFGDNLEQSLKAVRATSKVVRSGPMRGSSSFQRFHPYRRQYSRGSGALNFSRPLQAMGTRGGQNYRGHRGFISHRGTPSWQPQRQKHQ